MPIYEYQCPACHTVFEEWLSVSEATETAPCPQCKTEAVHIISNTAFVLKGGGWYVTDYGNRKNESANTQTSASSTNTAEASSTATTDSTKASTSSPNATSNAKPDAKTATKVEKSQKTPNAQAV